MPAHLFDDHGVKRCSVCKMPFPPDVKPSMSVAFAQHVLKAHQPGQTSEDVNQAAARIVGRLRNKKRLFDLGNVDLSKFLLIHRHSSL